MRESDKMAARWPVSSGTWLALAVVLPVAVHPFGLGPLLLPMHLPVLLAGALSGAKTGMVTGVLAPLISNLLTGMPPMAPPVAPLMAVELATYGLTAGLARTWLIRERRGRGGTRVHSLAREYAWLIVAWLAGRLALGLAAWLLGPLLGLAIPPLVYVQGAIFTGLPGIALQAAVVPPLLARWAPPRGDGRPAVSV